jgi:hypothetical protein
MRRILGYAGATVAAVTMLIGLTAGPAQASDDCEDPNVTEVWYVFNNDDGTSHLWRFICNEDGTARFGGGY